MATIGMCGYSMAGIVTDGGRSLLLMIPLTVPLVSYIQ